MAKFSLKVFPSRSLGIDVGTSSIKIVELSGRPERIKLENYGEIKTLIVSEKPFRMFERSTFLLATHRIGQSLRELLKEANAKSKRGSFSIPDFSSFFTAIEFPPMREQELEEAVRYEARRHVPLPLREVVLDWQLVDKKLSLEKKKNTRVLLVAVPKEVIEQYEDTAKAAQIELSSLEAEVFSLIRALKADLEGITGLIEIGAQSSTVSIVDGDELKTTHTFDVSGNELTQTLSRSLQINYPEAEVLKKVKGIKSEGPVKEALIPLIDLILNETKRVIDGFAREEGRDVDKFILAGSTAMLPGLKDYFSQELKKGVTVANPFKGFTYPSILEGTLQNSGPSFAIAVGIAKRGLE